MQHASVCLHNDGRSEGQDNEHTPLDSDDRAPREANILAAGNDECQGTEGVTATAHMTVSSVTNDLDASEEDAPAAAAAMAASCSTSGSHSQVLSYYTTSCLYGSREGSCCASLCMTLIG